MLFISIAFWILARNSKPKLVYNQFGGSIGGPIKKNKVFFFGDYEGTFERRFADGRFSIPTMAMRNGDLTASPTRIFDPFTVTQQTAVVRANSRTRLSPLPVSIQLRKKSSVSSPLPTCPCLAL